MNANDIEQIILDLPPGSAAEIIWDIIQDTAFQLDEAEAGLAYYRMKSRRLEGETYMGRMVSAKEMSDAWNKYWSIKKGNEQRRKAALM